MSLLPTPPVPPNIYLPASPVNFPAAASPVPEVTHSANHLAPQYHTHANQEARNHHKYNAQWQLSGPCYK